MFLHLLYDVTYMILVLFSAFLDKCSEIYTFLVEVNKQQQSLEGKNMNGVTEGISSGAFMDALSKEIYKKQLHTIYRYGLYFLAGTVQKCWCVRYIGIDIEYNTRTIPVPTSRNINELSGLYSLQLSLEIGSFVKMLVRELILDRYRITQDKFMYQRAEIDVSGLYPLSKVFY